MKKLKAFLTKISGFRIALVVALVFLMTHVLLEVQISTGDRSGFLYRLELAALDMKFITRKPIAFDPKVTVVRIDEKSIERFGLWPWNRAIVGQIVDRLAEYDVKVVAMDTIFADEDKNSTFKELKRFKDVYDESGLYRQVQPAVLGQTVDRLGGALATLPSLEKELKIPGRRKLGLLSAELEAVQGNLVSYQEKSQRFYDVMASAVKNISPDEALAQSIRKSKRVITGYFLFTHDSELAGLPPSLLERNFERVKRSGITDVFENTIADGGAYITRPVQDAAIVDKLKVRKAVGVQSPLPLIAEASEHFGYFNVEPDPDGRLRAVPLLFKINGLLLPSLELQAAALYYGGGFTPIASALDERGISGVSINDDRLDDQGRAAIIPTDERGNMMVNYYGDPERVIPSVSAVDVVERTADPKLLKGRVAFFGATAIATYDLRSTPYSVATPGVFVHASAAQNVLDGRYFQRWSGFVFVEAALFLLLGIAAGLVVPRIRIGFGLLFTIALVAGLLLVDFLLVFPSGNWLRTVAPVAEVLTIFVAITIFRYMTEEREKRVIRNAFQFYLTKSVVESVLKDASKLKLGGEKRDLSVMFSDIRGFTTISERLPPEGLVHLLNDYLTPMTDIVFHHEGTLDKYMGDAIMAFWGAPVEQKDHATRACNAALEMMAKLKILQDSWRAQGLPEIDIGIGINSGPMAVGNMGSAMRFDYTVMGDSVNLGSRLEGINKEYGTNIIISEFTLERCKDDMYVRQLDAVRVKGKREPVKIFELRGRGRPDGKEQEFISVFESGLEKYRAQEWDAAIATFRECLALQPTDYCSNKYIDRCESMKEDPPGDGWDGVYTMKTK